MSTFTRSFGLDAYTIAVWSFADWLSRNPAIGNGVSTKKSPVVWTREEWSQAAQLEEGFREFGSLIEEDDGSAGKHPTAARTEGEDEDHLIDFAAGLQEIRDSVPLELHEYVGEECDQRDHDGVLRRLPDTVVRLIASPPFWKPDLDATSAMEDALVIFRRTLA